MLQALVDGILLGGVYGVIATGLALVFGVLGIVNFAHAEFLMLGMYVAWFGWRYLGLDPLLGSVLSFVVVFVIGYLVQRVLIARVLAASAGAQIFLTVGLLIAIQNAALLLLGSQSRSVTVPYQVDGLRLGDIFLSAPYLYAFVAAVILAVGLWFYLDRSWTGRAIRAVAQDPIGATLSGVDGRNTYACAFGLGVALTAFGGAIILPYIAVSPTIGAQFGMLMFTVVVLGGLGSVAGALVGGLAVGLVQSLSAMLFPMQLQNLCLFLVFIAVLALRPQGLIRSS